MAHCTQLCTTKKNFYSQQIKKFFLGITLFDTFSLLFQKEKNLMPLFLIACNRGLKMCFNIEYSCHTITNIKHGWRLSLQLMTN